MLAISNHILPHSNPHRYFVWFILCFVWTLPPTAFSKGAEEHLKQEVFGSGMKDPYSMMFAQDRRRREHRPTAPGLFQCFMVLPVSVDAECRWHRVTSSRSPWEKASAERRGQILVSSLAEWEQCCDRWRVRDRGWPGSTVCVCGNHEGDSRSGSHLRLSPKSGIKCIYYLPGSTVFSWRVYRPVGFFSLTFVKTMGIESTHGFLLLVGVDDEPFRSAAPGHEALFPVPGNSSTLPFVHWTPWRKWREWEGQRRFACLCSFSLTLVCIWSVYLTN